MANRPKGKLFALLAIFAAIGLVAASGAFTSVTATRTANVTVAGDGAALLQLEPYDGPNGDDYALLQDGELEISLSGFGNVQGDGLNLNATTNIQNVFNITNQGSQQVAVNISDVGDGSGADNSTAVVFYTTNTSIGSGSQLSDGGLEQTDENDVIDGVTGPGSAVTLDPGEGVEISIYVDTTAVSPLSPGADLVEEITINATETSP